MRVVVAPDKFKGSLTAVEVARAICEGLSAARPDIEVVAVPVADGGDGTLDAVAGAGFTRVPIQATGPTGLPVTTCFAVRAGTVVVELADVVGLARLPQGVPAPLAASTYGLGEVVRAVFKHAADRLVVGVGGSASTDGGAGLVQALGARLVDSSGDIVRAGGGALLDLARIDTSDLCPLPAGLDVLVACDVDNPLVGPSGAARVFARQKGASPHEVDLLERAMQRWADVTRAARGLDVASHPGAGAAGGVAFAAMAYLGARLESGIELVLDLIDFDRHLEGADLVITGEGSIDGQTLRGKAPVGVARAAAARGIPVVAIGGRVGLTPAQLRAAGFRAAYSLADLEPDLERSLGRAAALVEQTARTIALERIAIHA